VEVWRRGAGTCEDVSRPASVYAAQFTLVWEALIIIIKHPKNDFVPALVLDCWSDDIFKTVP